jgi:uncharacterized caspase-like protein
MRVFPIRLLLVLLAAMRASEAAAAERRVALVIGNAAYAQATPLLNPVIDAADMTDKLKELGFEVLSGQYLPNSRMNSILREFRARLDRADVALFYYAGHGLQINNQNYLLGTDAKIEDDLDIEHQTVRLDVMDGTHRWVAE